MNNPTLIKEFKEAYAEAFTCECCSKILQEDEIYSDNEVICEDCFINRGIDRMESYNDLD